LPGINFLVDLLLQTGQVSEARVLLDREEIRRNPTALGIVNVPGYPHPDGKRWTYQFPAYEWYNFCQFAASGRYNMALTSLDVIREFFARQTQSALPRLAGNLNANVVAELGLAGPGGLPGPIGFNIPRYLTAQTVAQLTRAYYENFFLGVFRADLTTLVGLLELERGHTAGEAAEFENAQRMYREARPLAPATPGMPLVTQYLEAIRRNR
jgi:hypothetical protein